MRNFIFISFLAVLFINFENSNLEMGNIAYQGPQLTGDQLYTKYCLTCHQADGKGVRNMFPPLSGNQKITGPSDDLIKIVLFGLQGPITVNERGYNQPMPAQAYLTDKQISDILTYIRSSWENKASPIKPEEVSKIRSTGKPK